MVVPTTTTTTPPATYIGARVVLTLLAALGIVMFVLFAIEIYRDSMSHDIQVGAWVSLGGSIVALIGGFVPARRTAAVATGPIAETEEP
jgi:hypothetical protein